MWNLIQMIFSTGTKQPQRQEVHPKSSKPFKSTNHDKLVASPSEWNFSRSRSDFTFQIEDSPVPEDRQSKWPPLFLCRVCFWKFSETPNLHENSHGSSCSTATMMATQKNWGSVPWTNPCKKKVQLRMGLYTKRVVMLANFLVAAAAGSGRTYTVWIACGDNRCDVGIWIFKTKLSIEQHRKIQNHLSLEDVSLTS